MQNQKTQQATLNRKVISLQKQPVSSIAKSCAVFDLAAILMLQREEALLGDILSECNELMTIASQEADEVADSIEEVI